MPRKYKKVTREHKPRTRVKEDSRSRAIALIDAGLNTSQIEEQTGVSRSQIRRYKRNLRLWNNPSAPRLKTPGRPPKSAAARLQRDDDADDAMDAIQPDLTPLTEVIPISQHQHQQQRDPTQPSRIAELATIIATNTAALDHYLRANNLPPPSFSVDAPTQLIPEDALDMRQAHTTVLEATAELQDLLTPPASLCRPVLNGTSLHAIQRFGIPQKVPVSGSISFVQLAKECDISEPDVRRILRYAMVHHRMFCEPVLGFVAHSAASRALAEDASLQDEVSTLFEDVYPAYSRTVDALEQFRGDEPNQCGFSLSHDTDLTLQSYLQKKPEKDRHFSSTLASLACGTTTGDDPSASGSIHPFTQDLLISAFPWAMMPPGATIVDMSSVPNTASLSIAEIFPHMSLVVQGRAAAVREVRVPAHMEERVTLMPHDAFADQPVVGADVYLFRGVFRNWPDKFCVRMLQKLVPALKVGARVIINDTVMPEPKAMALLAERQARAADLTMMTLCNSKERERSDWVRLLERADKRLRVSNIQAPSGGRGLGMIEAVWTE